MIKKFLFLGLCVALLLGFSACNGNLVNLKPSATNECIDAAQYPNSIILKKISNPCQIYKAIVTVSKVQVALDEWTYTDTHNKIAAWTVLLESVKEVSAKSVKDSVLLQLARVNKKVGVALFLVSDAFIEFSDETMFGSDDIKILIIALKDIDKQLKAMTVFE